MSIKHKIKIKQQPEEDKDEIEDVVRYEEQDEKEYKKQLKKAALTIQRFLSLSDDKEELANLEYPNTDSWMWSDRMKKEATKIWK